MAQRSKINLSKIAINPLSSVQKSNIINKAFGTSLDREIVKLSSIIYPLSIYVNNYIKEYDRAWAKFDKAFKVTLQPGIQESKLKGYKQSAIDFMRILEKGEFILQELRKFLTGQTITTNFTITDSQNKTAYRKKKENISYKLVLSTYSKNANVGQNFVNLAYKVDVTQAIKSSKSEILKSLDNIEARKLEEQVYTQLYKLKYQLIAEGKYHKAYIDATDAEIVNSVLKGIRNLTDFSTTNTYLNLRVRSGKVLGKPLTALQMGDVYNEQEKKVSQSIKTVNYARQTFIRARFIEIQSALNSSFNPYALKQTFLNMFTVENYNDLDVNLEKQFQKEARENIEKMFRESGW